MRAPFIRYLSPFSGAMAGGLAALSVLATAGVSPLLAQSEEEVPDSARSVLEGVYTEEQATAGSELFLNVCWECHDTTEFEGEEFIEIWKGPLRAFYKQVTENMPENNPGGLKPEEYAAVTAYILQLNGYPPGEVLLPGDAEALRLILLEPKHEGGR